MRTIVIMAGGSGTRFWPLSRQGRPKQLLALTSEQPMLVETYERVRKVAPPEHIYIVANSALITRIRGLLPELPDDNFLVEPEGRNTAPCLAYAAAVLAGRHGEDCAMGIMTSDHLIGDHEAFARNTDLAIELAEREDLFVSFGLRPTEPNTGYGYLETGEPLAGDDPRGRAMRLTRYHEKPDLETAREYYASEKFLWNSGMFFWKISTLIEGFGHHAPEFNIGLRQMQQAVDNPDFMQVVVDVFNGLPAESIDIVLMEKAKNQAVVIADFDWDDVGTWTALSRTQKLDSKGNLLRGKVLALDSENSVIFNSHREWASDEKLVVALGVKDLVVVSVDDCLLVCHRDRVQDIKKIQKALRESGEEQYL